MKEREEVKKILLEILGRGLLRIRAFGWSGRHQECAHEADHLHNLPRAILEGSMQSFSYYYDIERPAFLKEAIMPEEFEPYWDRLKTLLLELDSETKTTLESRSAGTQPLNPKFIGREIGRAHV